MKHDPIFQAVARREAQAIISELSGAVAVVIATADGFDVASATTRGVDANRVAAMASSISAIGDVVSQEANLGRSKSVTVTTERGFAYIGTAHCDHGDVIVNVIADGSAVLAQVMRRTQECVTVLERA